MFFRHKVYLVFLGSCFKGFEDRQKYQIIWMFFISLIVALIYSLVASKIVYQLLGLFGVHSYLKYISEMVSVIEAFAIIYLIIFKLTSNVYYKFVR